MSALLRASHPWSTYQNKAYVKVFLWHFQQCKSVLTGHQVWCRSSCKTTSHNQEVQTCAINSKNPRVQFDKFFYRYSRSVACIKSLLVLFFPSTRTNEWWQNGRKARFTLEHPAMNVYNFFPPSPRVGTRAKLTQARHQARLSLPTSRPPRDGRHPTV